MGLYEGRGQLGKLMKDYLLRWHETRVQWDDHQAKAFEERYVIPLDADQRVAVSAMDQMAILIAKIKQDCE